MAYAGSKRFQYQQLQYCPQRNVSSISKEKMFNSTVSKYDPRTGRTTRLQNCIPYDQLIAKDRTQCSFQRCIPVPPPNIIIQLATLVEEQTFYWNAIGGGFVDYGFGQEAFQGGEDGLRSPEMNLNGAYFRIYSNNITSLLISGGQSLDSIDVSNCFTLVSLYLSANQIVTVKGLNKCKNIHTIDLSNNGIAQITANSIATDLFNSGAKYGSLSIADQSSGTLNINTPAFLNLINNSFWTVS